MTNPEILAAFPVIPASETRLPAGRRVENPSSSAYFYWVSEGTQMAQNLF